MSEREKWLVEVDKVSIERTKPSILAYLRASFMRKRVSDKRRGVDGGGRWEVATMIWWGGWADGVPASPFYTTQPVYPEKDVQDVQCIRGVLWLQSISGRRARVRKERERERVRVICFHQDGASNFGTVVRCCLC